jgi:hypothetical protein
MTMTTKAPENLTNIDEATTARWLATALEHARADVKTVPTAEAVDRIRARVLGIESARKTERSIAA